MIFEPPEEDSPAEQRDLDGLAANVNPVEQPGISPDCAKQDQGNQPVEVKEEDNCHDPEGASVYEEAPVEVVEVCVSGF